MTAAPPMTDDEIAAMATQLRDDLAQCVGRFGPQLPVVDLVQYLHKRDGLTVDDALLGKDVVGMIEIRPDGGRITLDRDVAMSPMSSFTAAHEIGHWILHRRAVEQGELVTLRRDLGAARGNPVEWQANRFAVHLLMPSDLVAQEFRRRYGTISRVHSEQPGTFLERWPRRRDYAKFMASRGQSSSTSPLTAAFGVSGIDVDPVGRAWLGLAEISAMTIEAFKKHRPTFEPLLRELLHAGGTGYYHPVDDYPRIAYLCALLELGFVERLPRPDDALARLIGSSNEAFVITELGVEALLS